MSPPVPIMNDEEHAQEELAEMPLWKGAWS